MDCLGVVPQRLLGKPLRKTTFQRPLNARPVPCHRLFSARQVKIWVKNQVKLFSPQLTPFLLRT